MRLEDCGFTDEEVLRIKMMAKIFNCQRMFIVDRPNDSMV